MTKNDGWADVQKNQFDWQVVINHFEGEPEIWDKFKTEQDAREEMVLWNIGNWGEGFTYSAEWFKKHAEESKG